MPLSERVNRTRKQWNILTYYQGFESAVAFVLTLVIALIVLVALYRLCVGVVTAFLFEPSIRRNTPRSNQFSARS